MGFCLSDCCGHPLTLSQKKRKIGMLGTVFPLAMEPEMFYNKSNPTAKATVPP